MKLDLKKYKIRISKYNLSIIFNVLLFIVIIFLVSISIKKQGNNDSKNFITRSVDSSYLLTNPILDCENSFSGKDSIIPFDLLSEKVSEVKNKYSVEDISIYFRDLNNGPWVGINENEVFSPASLLKVPIMMELLYEAQYDQSLLEKIVKVTPSDINTYYHQNITFENLLSVDKDYSLEEVAKSMIQKSDNTGTIVLLNNIDNSHIGDIFRSIGVPYKDTNTEVSVKIKEYAGFFRVLFNSSYLNREMSEKALKILSESEYRDGIAYGIPRNIIIAHKFGERETSDTVNNTQLHDCGIIYYPNKPYILCIMTKDDSFKMQEKVIQDLSIFIYKKVDEKARNS